MIPCYPPDIPKLENDCSHRIFDLDISFFTKIHIAITELHIPSKSTKLVSFLRTSLFSRRKYAYHSRENVFSFYFQVSFYHGAND